MNWGENEFGSSEDGSSRACSIGSNEVLDMVLGMADWGGKMYELLFAGGLEVELFEKLAKS